MLQTEQLPELTSLGDDDLAHILWDYHHLDTQLKDEQGDIQADALIVCGSNEDRVAERAAELYLGGHIGTIIFSGSKVHERFEERFGAGVTEAEAFARIALEKGVPADAIIIENKASNTPQNIRYSNELLDETTEHVILVTAAQHERRSLATAMKQMPDRNIRVTSPVEHFEEFINHPKYHTGRIRALVGHTLRLHLFDRKGDLVSQDIPQVVREAYRELIHRGYTPLGLESIKEDMENLGIDLEMHDLDREPPQESKELQEPSLLAEGRLR